MTAAATTLTNLAIPERSIGIEAWIINVCCNTLTKIVITHKRRWGVGVPIITWTSITWMRAIATTYEQGTSKCPDVLTWTRSSMSQRQTIHIVTINALASSMIPIKGIVVTQPVSSCPATNSTVLRATHTECSRPTSVPCRISWSTCPSWIRGEPKSRRTDMAWICHVEK